MPRTITDPVLGILREITPMTNTWRGGTTLLGQSVGLGIASADKQTPVQELLEMLRAAIPFVERNDLGLRKAIADEFFEFRNNVWNWRVRPIPWWDQTPDFSPQGYLMDLSLKFINVQIENDTPYIQIGYDSESLLFGDRWPTVVMDRQHQIVSVILE